MSSSNLVSNEHIAQFSDRHFVRDQGNMFSETLVTTYKIPQCHDTADRSHILTAVKTSNILAQRPVSCRKDELKEMWRFVKYMLTVIYVLLDVWCRFKHLWLDGLKLWNRLFRSGRKLTCLFAGVVNVKRLYWLVNEFSGSDSVSHLGYRYRVYYKNESHECCNLW